MNEPTPATETMSLGEQKALYLEDLLQRQLAKLRSYDLDGALRIAEQSGPVAQSLTQEGVLTRPEMAESRRRIQGLYQEVCLTIAAERQEVSGKLQQIRDGLRTLSVYGGK